MFGQLRALIRKEVQQTLRDRRMMFLLVVAPLLQTVVFGFAVDFETSEVPTGVIDLDQSVESRRLVRRMFADDTLVLARRGASPALAATWLVDDVVDMAVIIPEGFGRGQVRGERVSVQALSDGTDPNRSAAAEGYVTSLLRGGDSSPIAPRQLLNPGLDTAPYMLPGVAGVLLLLITTIIASMGLARERETGTLEQLQVTPMPAAVILVGKVAPFAAIGFVDFVFAFSIAHFGFGMPLRGSLAELAVIGGLYLSGTLFTGLAVSTFSRTQQQAFLGGFLVLLPAALLSGVFTPLESMPNWMQWLTVMNPLRHFAALVRGNAFAAQTLFEQPLGPLALMGYAALVGTLAVVRFARTQE
ncbi:MAG: ABC transporter permease [Myxococcota bacterium]